MTMTNPDTLSPALLSAIQSSNDAQLQLLDILARVAQRLAAASSIAKVKAGRKTVTTAGTPERISADPLKVRWVVFCAPSGNTDVVTIGGGSTQATAGSEQGLVLSALGMSPKIENVDLNEMSIDAAVSGEGVSYVYACAE